MTFFWLVPFADSFVNSDWLELAINFQTTRNYFLKKSVKTLRLCSKRSIFFRRPWHCLQMQAETAWTFKSNFVSAMPIEHRPLLTQQSFPISLK